MVRHCISVVLPVYNENENIAACLRGLWRALSEHEHEILVCYDFDEDKTLPAIAAMSDKPRTVRLVKNTLGRGAAFAIRAGFAAAEGDAVVTTMADLCDPPEVIPLMARKIREEGADVVAGSRYMRGGSQSGGPWLKRTISRWVGWSMWWIANLGTHDATTNFRAYSKRLLDSVEVESKTSFDIALELTVKAHLRGAKVAEVPSSWIDRTAGQSRFQMWKWMPNYLRWYVRAMAAPLIVLTALIALSISGWMIVRGMQETALHAAEELAVLTLACIGVLWLARRIRGRTRTFDVFHVLVWLLPWQLWPIEWWGWLATAAASCVWLGTTCGWKRTSRGLMALATDGGKRSGQSTVGLILMCVLVWLASIIMPRQIAANDPDMCWSRSLGYALTHKLRFGSDIAFTYGPLGYFTTGMFERELFTLKVLGSECAFKLLAAAFLTLGAVRMAGPLDRAIYFVALLFLPYNFDSYAFAVLACVTAHLVSHPHGSPVMSVAGVLVLAAMSLTKFNLVVVGGVCMLAIAIARWAEVGFSPALKLLGAFVAFYVVLWLVCGQSLLDLPSYFVRSAQIARGYNEGESESGYLTELYYGLAIGALMLGLLALYALRRPRTRARLALAAAFLLIFFVAFKTGFVRIADHPVIFFAFAPIGACLIPPAVGATAWIRAASVGMRFSCFALVVVCFPGAVKMQLTGWPDLIFPQFARFATNIEGLLDLSTLQKTIEHDEDKVITLVDMPRVRKEVGSETIDMVSCEQAVLYLNGLEWRPRPVFMSYATMSPELVEWNAAFFESERAPKYVLSRLNSIDMRLLTMDDGLALLVLGRDYEPVLCEKGMILLRRNPAAKRGAELRSVMKRTVAFGERVRVGYLEGNAHVLKVDIRYTAWGKLWAALYKAPPLWMHVWTESGAESIVRIVPGMMKTGALIDPYISSQRDWIAWLTGGDLPRVKAISLDVPESPAMFADEIDVEILDADALAPERNSKLQTESGIVTFDPPPAEIIAGVPTTPIEIEGHSALIVQAPATIRFAIPAAGAYNVSAVYGLIPEAYTVNQSDGVSFSALVQEGAKKKILFHRFVDPLHRAHDRGAQNLSAEFTTSGPADVYFYTNPGIHNDAACDWAYWGTVRIWDQDGR